MDRFVLMPALLLLSTLAALGSEGLVGRAGLEGDWQTLCDPIKKTIHRLSFKAAHVESSIQKFSDQDCKVPFLKMIQAGEFRIGKVMDGARSIHEYDLVLKSIHYLAVSTSGVQALNSRKVCGVADWRVGEVRDISKCRESAMAEQTRCFSIVRIGEAAITFGKDTKERDCSSPEKRPSELSTNKIFRLRQ
jgi:hypothetical protein